MRCPNINHPDWKELVATVGVDAAYLAYIKNGYDIPVVNYQLKAIRILQSAKADEIFRKGDKNNWSLDKILDELQIPKDQQKLLKRFDTRNREELITSLLANYSYAIEINIASKKQPRDFTVVNISKEEFEKDSIPEVVQRDEIDFENNIFIEVYASKTEGVVLYDKEVNYATGEVIKYRKITYKDQPDKPTQYYSNLTVPGGSNYRENEIATPAITPSIKGHAQFSTDKGIGWFRSDDQNIGGKFYAGGVFEGEMIGSSTVGGVTIKTRRILEVQSDLFQKGRNKEDLILSDINDENEWLDEDGAGDVIKAENQHIVEILKAENQNQFLQLLNKDNNWVTFFIKAIIQDSTKKGYEKVLFPSGNTAAKVEGHTTLEDFKKQKQESILVARKRIQDIKEAVNEREQVGILTEEEKDRAESNIDSYNYEIFQYEEELIRIEKEGFGALKPIYKFYEETVANILNKNGYTPKLITDEYGNTWQEIEIKPEYNLAIEFDIPAKSAEASELLLPGFDSFYQQNEAVNVLASSFLNFINGNPEIKAGAWKKAMEAWKTKIETKHKENPNRAFEAILNNFAAIEELAHQKLQLLGLRKRTRLDGINLDTYKSWMHEQGEDMDNMDEQDVINSWKDEWVFQFDAKDNALKQLKAFLAFIPKSGYDEESDQYYDIDSFIPDEVSFMSYDEVYEQLKGILAGVENTWEAMVEEMQKHTKAKPFIHNLLTYVLPNYSGDIEQLKRQFVSSMSSSYGGFKTILIKEYNGEYYFNTIDTDVASVQKTLLATWSGQFKRTDLFEETEEGNLVPNKAKVKAYLDKIKEVQANPTTSNVGALLKGIGVDLDEATLKQLVDGKVNGKSIASQFTDKKDGLFTLIAARLQGEVSADINESTEGDETSTGKDANTNNPIVNNSAITGLARLEAKNAPYAFSNTFRDGEGNTVYSYTFNKFITKEFIKLQNDPEYVKELLDITFNKPIVKTDGELLYKTWLYELANNPTFKGIFNISPFDTTRLVVPGRDGTKLSSMGELDLELTKVALMQNSGATKKGIGTGEARIIKYLLTVPSKTTSYIIQGSGQDVKVRFNDKGEYVIDPATKDALYSIVASEYNRILSQQARKNKNKAYDKGSTLFYFFPELNEDTRIFDENKQLLLPTTVIGKDKAGEDITVERYLRKKVIDIVNKTTGDTYKTWVDLGIITDGRLKLVDRNYKQKVIDPQAKGDKNKEITLAIVDYVVNSMLAKFNVHQTFIDDPALYFKASKEVRTAKGNVDETWSNVSKRLTNLIAPFKDGMIDETNAHFLSIKIQDQVVNALNHAQLKARLSAYYEENNIKFPYEDITGTDGQEYTTITEAVKVMYMYGNLTTAMYNDLLARIKKYGDDLVLTENEIGAIFGATKPVYSSRVISKADDAVYREYIKTAAFPLLPQFTKGLEIDKLRKSMEKVETRTGLSVRAVSASGAKLGGAEFAPIWNEDGTMNEELDLERYSVVLDRRNFGEQQPIPYDENKDEVIKSTQATKLLFDAISDLAGFKFEGARLKGEELQKIYDDLHKKIYEDGLKKLETALIKDGQIHIPSLSKMLIEEGINRGYSDAQLSFLRLNKEGTDFDIPFWAHIANEKEQALITSLYSNNVIKQKMPGGSYVLVSEEGIKGKSLGITYVGNTAKEITDKTIPELLDTILPAEAATKKVTIVTTDPTDDTKTVEEYEASTAVKDLKEQYTRLENLLQCLTK